MAKAKSILEEIKGHLMTGISYILPLIIGASIELLLFQNF